jgi:hypothetical protein
MADPAKPNAIYFPFTKPPVTGGDFVACDHIAELMRLGFDAKALYLAGDEGLAQFPVPVLRGLDLEIHDGDMFVIGEIYRDVFENLRGMNCQVVMLNQNPFYSYVGFDSVAALNAYPLAFIVTPSDVAAKRLRDAGVRHAIHTIRPALPEMFKPGPKKLQIAYSPSKRQEEAHYIRWAFAGAAPEFARVPWIALDGLTRPECARILSSSAIYAAFPQLESLGLMSLEAMASGCHVTGYTAIGGEEYAAKENGDWIKDGDHASFIAALKLACANFASQAADPKPAAALKTASEYSLENFRTRVAEVYRLVPPLQALKP